MVRWQASIAYRTNSGSEGQRYDLEEIGDLQGIIENGFHWDTVESVTIDRVNHVESDRLTVEDARNL